MDVAEHEAIFNGQRISKDHGITLHQLIKIR
jgi:hypothetical protein